MVKKKTVKPWRAAKEQSTQPNAFERIYNRKKFDVLGKKQKGERKHGKARSDAVTKVSPTRAVSFLQGKPATTHLTTSHMRRERTRCWWSTEECRGPMPLLISASEVGLCVSCSCSPGCVAFPCMQPWMPKDARPSSRRP